MYPYFFVLCPIFPVLFFFLEEEEEEATKGSGCQKAENQKKESFSVRVVLSTMVN